MCDIRPTEIKWTTQSLALIKHCLSHCITCIIIPIIYSDRLENILCLCLPKVNVVEEASPHLSLKCPYLWQFLWCLIQCYHINYSVFHVNMRLGFRLVVGHIVVFHTITLMSGYHAVFFGMEFRNKYHNEIQIFVLSSCVCVLTWG